GNDIGSSYRSAIFFMSEKQKTEAEKIIKEINSSNNWPGAIVTEVTSAETFWPAEKEHQDYLQNHPGGYTCHFERPDWKLI
ncbi:TPA: peptide-methionine (S)-S-oxide reductase, partial [Salmonella enterica subsp. enterica serovar Typhimurium]